MVDACRERARSGGTPGWGTTTGVLLGGLPGSELVRGLAMRCGVGGLLVWRSVGGQGVAGCWPLYRTSALAHVALKARRGWTVRAEAVEAPCGRPFGRTTATSGAPFVALRGIDDLKAGTLQQYQALCRRYGIPAFADVHCPDGSLVHRAAALRTGAATPPPLSTAQCGSGVCRRPGGQSVRHGARGRGVRALAQRADGVAGGATVCHRQRARVQRTFGASSVPTRFGPAAATAPAAVAVGRRVWRAARAGGRVRGARRRHLPGARLRRGAPIRAADADGRSAQQGAEPTWPSREATAAESSDEPVPAGDHAEPDRTSAATPMSPHPKEALERELRLWTHAARRDARQRRRGAVSEPADGQATATVPSAASPQPLEYQLVQEVGRLTDNSWFEVQLQVFGVAAARGSGRSIIVAEHDAARQVLQALGVSSPAAEAPYRLRPETLRPAALLAVLLQRVRGSEASACDAAAWRQATDQGVVLAVATGHHPTTAVRAEHRPPASVHPASGIPAAGVHRRGGARVASVGRADDTDTRKPAVARGLGLRHHGVSGTPLFRAGGGRAGVSRHGTRHGRRRRWRSALPLGAAERCGAAAALWPLARQLLRERGALNAAAVSSPQVSQDLLAVLGAACWFSGTYTVPAAFIAEVQQRLHAEERRQQRTGHPDAPAGDSDLKGGARQRAHG
eukprot:ctg_4536.g615